PYGFWLVYSRLAPFRLADDGGAPGHPYAPGRDRRGALAAARGQLVARAWALGPGAGVELDGLSLALGPERLLGDAGRDQHSRQLTGARALAAEDHRRRAE